MILSLYFSNEAENGVSPAHTPLGSQSPSRTLNTSLPQGQRRESFLYRSDSDYDMSPKAVSRNSSLASEGWASKTNTPEIVLCVQSQFCCLCHFFQLFLLLSGTQQKTSLSHLLLKWVWQNMPGCENPMLEDILFAFVLFRIHNTVTLSDDFRYWPVCDQYGATLPSLPMSPHR